MGGHVIIRNSVKNELSDPLVHGALPDWMKLTLSATLAKDVADWTTTDCILAGHAVTWALCNL